MSTPPGPLAVRLLLCILVALNVVPSRGNSPESFAQWNHRAWTTKDGAPADAWAIAQTPDGWLWFGAPTGLYRFDGIQFERVEIEGLDPRRSRAISMLYASDTGALWIGYVYGGATLLQDGRFTHFGATEGLGRGTVLWVAEDARGGTWMSTGNGFWRYDGRAWTQVGSNWGFPDSRATALAVDQRGTLWVASEHAFYFLEAQSQRFQTTGIRVEGVDTVGLIESPDGRMWHTNDAGIHALPSQSARSPRPTVSNSRSSLTEQIDRSGSVWRLGGGIRRIPFDSSRSEILYEDHLQADRFTTAHGLTDSTAKTMLEDREGNIWVTTGGSVERFRLTNMQALPPQVSELSGYALVPGENGSVWIGTDCGLCTSPLEGLWKFDGQLKRVSIPGLKSVTAAELDADGKLWVAGPEGVWRQEGDRFQKIAEPPEGTRGQKVRALVIDLERNPWIAVTRSTLFRYRDGQWERNANLPELPDLRPTALERDREGRLWIGYSGEGKLFVVESGRAKLLGNGEAPDVGRIFALHTGTHTIVAGANRIALLDNGRFHTVTTPADPSVLEGVVAILEAGNGDLWFNSFKGAVRVTRTDLDHALQRRTYELPFELFDAEDGFPGISQPGIGGRRIAEGSDGRLWFAGSTNLATLDPKSIRRNMIPPPVAIRAITAAGQNFSMTNALSLDAGTRDLQVDYTALSLSRPDRIRFRYRLDGFDDKWVDAGSRRQAFYTNLEPGQYEFRVAAANENGVWNESGATLAIVIPPTFVQTRSFVALCVAAAILLLWFAYALHVRRLTGNLRNRLEERVAERERIARELHDTLLQGVQGLMLKFQAVTEEIPRDSPARQMMEQALDRADDVLIEGRDRVKDLRIQPTTAADLPPAIGEMGAELAKEQSTRFDLSVEGTPRPLDPIVREEVLRIAHEALVNAFRHARARKIETEIIYHRAELRLRIRDDGCGIDAAILKMGRPDHWGLPGMRERAKKIRADFDVWSGHGAGTEIELRVPARIAFVKNSWRPRWWPGRELSAEHGPNV